jgi:uncharacterized protein YidB (DUF937 family)
MSVINQILGAAVSSAMGGRNSPNAALVNMVLGMLGSGGQQAQPGMQGGLAALIQQFAQAGLGNVANSWVGAGENMSITPQQLQQVFGQQQVHHMAQQSGMGQDDMLQSLSQFLPGLVDHLTPQGRLPQQDSLQGSIGALLAQLGQR